MPTDLLPPGIAEYTAREPAPTCAHEEWKADGPNDPKWLALAYAGQQQVPGFAPVEMRQCACCLTTLSLELSTHVNCEIDGAE